jgi:hypothetical protein
MVSDFTSRFIAPYMNTSNDQLFANICIFLLPQYLHSTMVINICY